LAIIGLSWGGWMTTSSAKKSADIESMSAIVAALTPYCLERAEANPAALQVMAELKAASSYNRSVIIKNAGWATPLGSTEPNSDLAQACQIALGKTAS
jgi:poly(3-hydroxybutyrate) depolymerase